MTTGTTGTTGTTISDDTSRIVLDPFVTDLNGESARLRAAGPLAAVELPGGVPVWAVTHHAEAKALLTDPRLVKDINVWTAWQRGEIPGDWPLIGLANPGPSMLTVDGAEHRRLRTLVAQALTPRRVEHMRGRIEQLTAELLDALPLDQDVVDLKAEFAYPLPMYVIADLMGIDTSLLPRLKVLFDKFFSTQTPPEEVGATLEELAQLMSDTVAAKRRSPGDDLTSALIAASENGDQLTDEEIVSTLQLLVAAGHETTISLIVNAVVNLSTHPEQRALVLSGQAEWSAVIEETLRWSAPTSHVLFRFATEDVPVGDRVIPKGDALIVSYGAIGRDEQAHGPSAGVFDITRETKNRHISFGHGPHVCPGAALSRLEAGVALPALYARFPQLDLAVPASELRNKPVVTQNDLYELPVRLRP
ncbi:cytochrome P450 family protein [Streptomyces thermoviolaceus]|uniref:Cytochrome P450 n=1 Tax=Streptomyces thermoviolaceus subsp. thermoviolaceus TaxID=66860 RepID=A0ABX0YNG9_STRTL|nr:cytochrome P450 [Streptomyces thermoviolaceus]NJP13623.1 cytochrome P450 [Streptomyces thermoviolaceus subsp. thermoviolaceus]WTD46222.1 cytochrome P450 [Streptomyces thermoviolaceus]GGV65688.1 cytochrome P450 [Streptomyces thermoviolaceus subsp. apingens]GHA75478.1 cytochrome P450 [Streptomyces thermoviolaceus subsp. thermoviolaceus]